MLNQERRFFLLLLALYCIMMTIWILIVPKGEESIACYHSHTLTMVGVFKWITQLGEWIPIIGLAVYLLIKNRVAFLAALSSFLPLYFLVLYLKKTLAYPRPLAYFTDGEIHPISDYVILLKNSMPSGHTFSAFVVASFICTFYSLNRWVQCIVFGLACLVGFSRIYLLCHFKEDVFVGSLLGILAGVLPLFSYQKWVVENEV
jgi:membrane-associated phospholipid phosphatase